MKWLLTLLVVSSLYGQGFGYNYIDPCNQQAVNLNYTTETTQGGFWVTYYNQRQFFTWEQVADGTLQNWTQQVYSDFERLFPCAVNIAEEALASANTLGLTEELEESEDEDISASEPSFIGGDIVNTFYSYGSVTSLNSVYTEENFDLTKEFNYTMNITLDLKKVLGLYGRSGKSKEKNQSAFWNAGVLYYRTFEGSDWLITGNYGKVIKQNVNQVGLISSSIGQISRQNFLNINGMYGYRYPIKMKNNTLNLQTFVSYTIFRYYEGLKTENKYLLLESPILIYPGFNVDFNFTETFKMNFGFYVGYNTLVNDIGKRNISYSIIFGTNF
jgi:hypothetical protein|tara:strand:- start:2246 stop:3232 length:987 start_codon:yes stop_codon:yes gene_type:complete